MTADNQQALTGVYDSSREVWLMPTLAAVTFTSSVGIFALGPFLPVIADAFDTSVALLGQVLAVSALLAAGLGLIAGPLIDQFGYRRCLILAMVSLTVSSLGMGLAPGYAIFLLVAMVGALGRAIAPPTAQAIAGSRFDGDARRRAMSWMTGGGSVAFIIGVPILTLLDAVLGWRMAFAAIGLFAAGGAVLVGRVLTPDRNASAIIWQPVTLLAAYVPIIRHRGTSGAIVSQVLGLAGTGSLLTYFGAFLFTKHGLTTQQIGLVYIALGVSALIGTVTIASRIGARPLRLVLTRAKLGLGILGGAALLLPLPALAVAGLVTICMALMTICNAAVPTLLAAETPGGRATTMTLNTAAMSLGNALGAGVGGLLLTVGGYSSLGLSVLAWYGASAMLIWWSRPVLEVQKAQRDFQPEERHQTGSGT